MTITNKHAELLADNLRGKIEFKDYQQKGKWYQLGDLLPNNRQKSWQISIPKIRQIVGIELGLIYQTKSGYTQSDLNAAIKFMEMYLLIL